MLDDPEPQLYRPLDETPFTYIDTVAGLRELSQTLTSVREIAIDTEAHAYRSFSGFVCLMQISTRDEDYVVDTLALRAHMHMLNAALTDPAIVKVLHGADMDIVWLQRDFGLYVVNMFDTGQAARVLEFPRFSLAYLLDHYCGVTADKKYQLADWRIRPIPGEMLKYAREDTHYLLYIADRLRAELVARGNANKNFLHAAWNRSAPAPLPPCPPAPAPICVSS
jgi:exosome complex exonuclease RRP6